MQKMLSFFYFIYLARNLGEVGLGKYTFALSFASIFVIFMDFGLGPVLTREGARKDDSLGKYTRTVLGTKILLTIIVLIVMYATATAFYAWGNVPQDTYYLTLLASAIIVLDTFTFTFWSVFRARQNMKWEAIGVFIYQLLIVSSGSIALYFNLPLPYIVGAVLLGSTFNFIYALTTIKRKAGISIRPRINRKVAFNLLKIAAPFAFAGIFFKLNGSIDTVMLETLAGERYVGWYSVAFKLTTALTVLPGAFATSFYPAMSYHFKHSRTELRHIFQQAMIYLGFLALPIAVGTIILADPIILTVYGPAFTASIIALQIVMAGLIFIFLNYPVGNLLNACNKQMINTINMGIALTVNVIMNWFLIPEYTYVGAAISMLTSSILLVLLGLPHTTRIIKFPWRNIAIGLGKGAGAAAVMGLFVYSFHAIIHLALLIGLAAILYLLLLFLFRAIKSSDIKSLALSFKR